MGHFPGPQLPVISGALPASQHLVSCRLTFTMIWCGCLVCSFEAHFTCMRTRQPLAIRAATVASGLKVWLHCHSMELAGELLQDMAGRWVWLKAGWKQEAEHPVHMSHGRRLSSYHECGMTSRPAKPLYSNCAVCWYTAGQVCVHAFLSACSLMTHTASQHSWPALADYFGIEELSTTAHFPVIMETFQATLKQVEACSATRTQVRYLVARLHWAWLI